MNSRFLLIPACTVLLMFLLFPTVQNAQISSITTELMRIDDSLGTVRLVSAWNDPTGYQSYEQTAIHSRKNPGLAVLYSLLLPGMGELYAGNFATGKYLLGTEVGLWMTVYGLHSYGTWIRNDARSFAAVHAGVQTSGKDDKFFVNVGNFISREAYNEKKLRDRELASVYTDPSYDWHWESDAQRSEYRSLRVKSDQMLNGVRFAAAAIVANHVVSAIIASTSAVRYNSSIGSGLTNGGWNIGVIPLGNGFVASFKHTF
jgi:TM2 domain-containing membrane protein YozV